MAALKTYHFAWLSAHPERTEEWLRARLADGFQVHHIDGNHKNDDSKNLVLIEGGDHLMLHNGKTRLLWRPTGKPCIGVGRPKKVRDYAQEHSAAMRSSIAELDRLVVNG